MGLAARWRAMTSVPRTLDDPSRRGEQRGAGGSRRALDPSFQSSAISRPKGPQSKTFARIGQLGIQIRIQFPKMPRVAPLCDRGTGSSRYEAGGWRRRSLTSLHGQSRSSSAQEALHLSRGAHLASGGRRHVAQRRGAAIPLAETTPFAWMWRLGRSAARYRETAPLMIWAIQMPVQMMPRTNTPKPPKSLKATATTSTARIRMAQSGIMSTCLMINSLAVQTRFLARVMATGRLSSA